MRGGEEAVCNPLLRRDDYRKLAEDFLRSLLGRIPFDLGLVFLESEKDHRLYPLGWLSRVRLSRGMERALSNWSIPRSGLHCFSERGLHYTPGVRPYLERLGIKYCSYQVVNAGDSRAVLVLLGDRETDRREERFAGNFSALCHRMADNLGLTLYRHKEERRMRHIKALEEVSRIVTETYELPVLMERALAAVNEYFHTGLSYVLLYDEENEGMIKSIAMEMNGRLLHLDPDMRNRLLHLARERGMDLLAENLDSAGAEGTPPESLPVLTVPIEVDGIRVGAVKCSVREYLNVDELDMEFLTTMANQLAAGIKNVLNYRKLQEKSEVLRRLNSITRRLNDLVDAGEIIALLERELKEIASARRVFFVPLEDKVGTETPGCSEEWRRYLYGRDDLWEGNGIPLHRLGVDESGLLPDPGSSALLVPVGVRGDRVGVFVLVVDENGKTDMSNLEQMIPPLAAGTYSALRRVRYFAEAVRERGVLQAVFDAMRDAVLVVDENKRIVMVNREAERLFRLSAAGKLGERVRGSLGWEELERFAEGEVEEGADELDMIIEIDPPKPVKAYRARMLLPGSGKPGTVVVLRDVTHEKQLDHLKESFLSCVSHELNTPLSVVIGYTDILREGWHLHDDDAKRQYVECIRKGAQKLHRVITDILMTTKISRGRLELDLRPCRLDEVVADIVEQYRVVDGSRRYGLVVRHRNCLCDADEIKLRRVIWNLVDNARKFSPPGSTVEVEVGRRRDGVYFSVKDEGIGISPWHLPSIFSKFTQVDLGDARKYPGLGIGLYLAREIVEMHRGSIEVWSEPERGSVFTVVLPETTLPLRVGKEVVA